MTDLGSLGKYQLLRSIARGGMAEIFLARAQGAAGFEKALVVKRVLPHLAENAEFVQMFLDEARLAARLAHPGIVQIFDFGELDGSYYLCMEHLAGEDLSAVARSGIKSGKPIPATLAGLIISAAADALHYAHTLADEDGRPLKIVHRDISPSNLFVTYQGAVKVLDFGIAKAEGKVIQTRSGVIKGKLLYMSPEQASGKELDGRSDVFALGVVLHELLTGERLFQRDSELAILRAVMDEPIPTPRERNPSIPEELSEVVMRALERDRDRRFASAAKLQSALDSWLVAAASGPLAPQLAAYLRSLCGEERIRERTRIPTRPEGALPVPGVPGEEPTRLKGSDPAARARVPDEATRLKELAPETRLLESEERPARRGGSLVPAALGALATAVVGGLAAAYFGLLPLGAGPAGAPVPVGGPVAVVAPAPAAGAAPAAAAGVPAGAAAVLPAAAAPGAALAVAPAGAAPAAGAAVPAGAAPAATSAGAAAALAAAPASAAPAAALAAAPASSARAPAPAGPRRLPAPAAAAAPAAAPAPAAATGKLDLNCVPWCNVELDGKPTGRHSPVQGLELSAGRHKLRLVNPPSGMTREREVTVKAGQTTKELVRF